MTRTMVDLLYFSIKPSREISHPHSRERTIPVQQARQRIPSTSFQVEFLKNDLPWTKDRANAKRCAHGTIYTWPRSLKPVIFAVYAPACYGQYRFRNSPRLLLRISVPKYPHIRSEIRPRGVLCCVLPVVKVVDTVSRSAIPYTRRLQTSSLLTRAAQTALVEITTTDERSSRGAFDHSLNTAKVVRCLSKQPSQP